MNKLIRAKDILWEELFSFNRCFKSYKMIIRSENVLYHEIHAEVSNFCKFNNIGLKLKPLQDRLELIAVFINLTLQIWL